MATMKKRQEHEEPVIAGPFHLFEGSFILEFLEPNPSRNATVLMRTTYKANHALTRKGKGHPQRPPYHLHFDQSESFQVLKGAVGTTRGWDAKDTTWTAEDGTQTIPPYQPHTFWPSAESTEDSTMLLWAHPDGTPEPMDQVFFQTVLLYISDVHEKKASMDILQLLLLQHVTASAPVMFPSVTFLGSLRWWIPWKLQSMLAALARMLGYTPAMERYSSRKSD